MLFTWPVIAIIGNNSGTELVDFAIPYGVLVASNAADVITVATHPGPLTMRPALTLQAQTTAREFNARYPEGADYVMLPPVLAAERQRQAGLEQAADQHERRQQRSQDRAVHSPREEQADRDDGNKRHQPQHDAATGGQFRGHPEDTVESFDGGQLR